MRKEQETTYFFDEITRKDLKRINVEGSRIFVARRNQQTYHHEPIYELAILNKDRTKALFCTEEDFFGRKFYNTQDLDFLESKSLASLMDAELGILYSDEIFMARFPAIEDLNFRKVKFFGISFAKLVDVNKKILVQQRKFVDRKEKERREEPITLGDFERDETRIEPVTINANPAYGRSKQLGETRTQALIDQEKEVAPQEGRAFKFEDLKHECECDGECQCKKPAPKAEEAELAWL